MSDVHLRFRIHLDKDWHTDPVIDVDIGGDSLQEVITTVKAVAGELAAYAGAGVKKIDLVNGHEILGFIKIPI